MLHLKQSLGPQWLALGHGAKILVEPMKVADIDSDLIVLQVRNSKGAKDRTVTASRHLANLLALGTTKRLAVSEAW